jgi:hypothetical protein
VSSTAPLPPPFPVNTQGSSKYRNFFEGFAPHLQPALATFQAMLAGPNAADMERTLVELALMLPAQLQQLLALLPRLMRPLVTALRVRSPPA